MNFNQRRQFAHVALSSLMILGAGAAFAQDTKPMQTEADMGRPVQMEAGMGRGSPCPCSNPVNVHIVKNSGATSPLASDFRADMRLNESPYNGTQINKFFTDTLQWKMPASKTCELTGKVSIKLKSLGSPLNSNDTATVMAGGQAVPGMSVGPGALWTGNTPGQIKTLSYPLTNQIMQSGKLSFVTQDDTAVLEFKVDIVGCCINPSR